MSKLRSRVALVLLLLLAAIVCAYSMLGTWRREPPPVGAPEKPRPEAAAPAPAMQPAAPETPRPTPATESAVERHARAFRDAAQYLDFVHSVLGPARAGDAEAQFWLYRALDYCEVGYRAWFEGRTRRGTLDEALSRAATISPNKIDEVRAVHSRCHSLMESDRSGFRASGQWLQSAAQQGHPLAQVQLANDMAMTLQDLPEAESTAAREDARRLVAQALRSRQPAVIFEAGRLIGLGDHAALENDMETVSWWIAACSRGWDCGPGSRPMEVWCNLSFSCQPHESLVEIFRRDASNFTELEARAADINRLIDSGDLDALGFGEASRSP